MLFTGEPGTPGRGNLDTLRRGKWFKAEVSRWAGGGKVTERLNVGMVPL